MFFKKQIYDSSMSRFQRRLFEKQVIQFKNTFSNFSNYQLQEIVKLINEILEERKKNERRKK